MQVNCAPAMLAKPSRLLDGLRAAEIMVELHL
jgi:hypothetical protein